MSELFESIYLREKLNKKLKYDLKNLCIKFGMPFIKWFKDSFTACSDDIEFTGYTNESVSGFCCLFVTDYDPYVIELYSLVTPKENRNKGWATNFIEEFIKIVNPIKILLTDASNSNIWNRIAGNHPEILWKFK